MTTLSRDLRRILERAVVEARRTAEAGARKALEALGVGHHEPWPGTSPLQRALRNRLRAHGRQLGDHRDERRGTQSIDRLTAECAYEHWHRMLFARFLAENALLIEPESGMDITLEDCQALARERRRDWLELAAEFAQRMLPQIFRIDDPTLAVALPAETQQALEKLLKDLPGEVFAADDGLGWVYQFWQSEQKDAVNKSGKKIGADELPAVTQLFTEDYMVWFLLHNTLGAWWSGRRHPNGVDAASEEDARKAVALPGVIWDYLRFLQGDDGKWRPTTGNVQGWPNAAKDVTVLDPCMGSGHFLVFALPMLVAMRMQEEALPQPAAVYAVLKDNLFGLEIDPRCTQLAAFNLALAAWKLGGHQALPALNLACSGLAPNMRETDWVALAGDNEKLRNGMERLYRLFKDAPVLGSLVNPRRSADDMYVADYHELQPLLEKALTHETDDDTTHELAVTARGLAKAAEILTGRFTLVATNVPYLGRGKQADVLQDYGERVYPDSKSDLATCFVERCLTSCMSGRTTALVTPQSWLFSASYKQLRERLLKTDSWNIVARLGSRAFETISGEVVNVVLLAITKSTPADGQLFAAIDVGEDSTPMEKAKVLSEGAFVCLTQKDQLRNPDGKVMLSAARAGSLLSLRSASYQGIKTGDDERVRRLFWELGVINSGWRFFQSTVETTTIAGGLERIIDWRDDGQGLARKQGLAAWGKKGVMISQMSALPAALYFGDPFDSNASPIVPVDPNDIPALWMFCSSPKYREEIRKVDQSLKPTNSSLVQVPFDLAHWQTIAAETYPNGLPKPHSDDPTQWLFNGHPKGSAQPLQVAVARLLGYHWPRQIGSSFPDCPALGSDELESFADDDGIVCISATLGEDSAADRLRGLLAVAYGSSWNAAQLNALLSSVGVAGKTLDDWLRDGFFEQHCALFHQRPFIWHVSDGRRDGFHALINYHKLAEGQGQGRRTLEKLAYAYLGDWIDRQRNDQKAGVEGADGRVAAAEHLKAELEKILEGEPPYDIFVRWKPLREQPIGWAPDINDGVRMNIRPFMTARPLAARGKTASILRVTPKGIKWDKDRGKEPQREKADFPWFWSWDEGTLDFAGGKTFDGVRWNDLHYSREAKQAARARKHK